MEMTQRGFGVLGFWGDVYKRQVLMLRTIFIESVAVENHIYYFARLVFF